MRENIVFLILVILVLYFLLLCAVRQNAERIEELERFNKKRIELHINEQLQKEKAITPINTTGVF